MKAIPYGAYTARWTIDGRERSRTIDFGPAMSSMRWDIRIINDQQQTLQSGAEFTLVQNWARDSVSNDAEIFQLSIDNTDHLQWGLKVNDIAKILTELSQTLVAYTAAQVLTNLAVLIKQMPFDDSARDQITAAVVMAMPNFEDSAKLKSPAKSKVVRTKRDFLDAVQTVQPAPSPISYDEYRAYDSMPRTPQ